MNTLFVQLRATIIALLDDENGINTKGYEELMCLSIDIGEGISKDIFDMVESSEGRYYLPEDHGLTAVIGETEPQ